MIEGAPSEIPSRPFRTQHEAVAAARNLIRPNTGGEVVIRSRNGRVRQVDTYVLGRSGFDKISAVEGISLSKEIEQDLETLNSKPLSLQERREWLIAKYGSPRDHVRRRK